ncbi:hypothetical protein [Streptomyces sp. NPDC086182]|uniref:hypothetical protein n=1 Tax=Streptomyces sp. NPDC086182 TaxID=3155058 RepID=UPI0034285405
MTDTNPQQADQAALAKRITDAVQNVLPMSSSLACAVVADAVMAVADAEQAELRAEIEKLIRWHREDGDALTEMRATIERLRGEKRKLGELAARRESELIHYRNQQPTAASAPVSPAPADWIDGHPQLESIAAAVWERCGRSDSGNCVEDDPRNIAVAALAAMLPASGPGGVAGETQQAPCGRSSAMPPPCSAGGYCCKGPSEAQQPETQAHPSHHRWYVETLDDLANEWAPGQRFTERADAVERYRSVVERHPTWKDGAPVQRRFVRETTSYTVEPAAVSQPDGEA